jgi:hypothetical protein
LKDLSGRHFFYQWFLLLNLPLWDMLSPPGGICTTPPSKVFVN